MAKRLALLVIVAWTAFASTASALTVKQQRAVQAIVFTWCGSYRRCAEGAAALRVSWCESRWRVEARNGSFLGLFQMGERERRLFGHGPGAWAQARAAHRYWLAVHRRWSPVWTCGGAA